MRCRTPRRCGSRSKRPFRAFVEQPSRLVGVAFGEHLGHQWRAVLDLEDQGAGEPLQEVLAGLRASGEFLEHDGYVMRHVEDRLEQFAMEVVSEPLALDAPAALSEAELDQPAALSVTSAPKPAKRALGTVSSVAKTAAI
jgi:hypothetical protein